MPYLCWQLGMRQNIRAQRHHRFVPRTWMSSWASSSDQVLLLHKMSKNMSEATSKTSLFQWSQSILRKCMGIHQPSDLRGCSLLINSMCFTSSEVIWKFRQQLCTTHLIAKQRQKSSSSSSWRWKSDKAASPQTAASICSGECIFKYLNLHCLQACDTFQSQSHAAGDNGLQLNFEGFLTIWRGQDQASTTESSHTKISRCTCDRGTQYILKINIFLYFSIIQKHQPHSHEDPLWKASRGGTWLQWSFLYKIFPPKWIKTQNKQKIPMEIPQYPHDIYFNVSLHLLMIILISKTIFNLIFRPPLSEDSYNISM